MKKCFKCGIEKELLDFYIHKKSADGHLNKCKECTKVDVKNNPRVFSNKVDDCYDNTEKGVIRVIYKTQRRSSKIRKMPPPNYSKEELKDWLYGNDFKRLYDEWVDSGFKKETKPSVDRRDDFMPYSLDNIRLVTWTDNTQHQHEDIMCGIGTGGLRCKPVICYDRNKKPIAEYVSFSAACRSIGYSIERSLKSGKPDRKNKFVWKYKQRSI